MLNWLKGLLELSFEKELTSLVTVAVVLGVWRTLIMVIQFLRMDATPAKRKFYPIYVPATLTILAASLYVSAVRTFSVFYPKFGMLALAVVVLLITFLVVLQAVKYVRSLLPGGTTPPCRWYKAWPMRALRDALPFTLSWVLSTLMLAIFLRELITTFQVLSDAGYTALGEANGTAQTVADTCIQLANFFAGLLPYVYVLWAVITFVLFIIRKGWAGMKRLAGRGTAPATP